MKRIKQPAATPSLQKLLHKPKKITMGQIDGFKKFDRALPSTREVAERLKDYQELYEEFPVEKTTQQAARCMDCGVPFCHSGCPLGNVIPEFNEAVYRNDWKEAYQILDSTNNFPEFTGRICPAPCEAACVLGINEKAVAIEHIEKSIIEKAYENGWVKPNQTNKQTGKKVAVIGSGPAGLATADELNKAGIEVHVYERKDRVGGLLRYGIPDFKLAKTVIDRRIDIMKLSGIHFHTNANIGENMSVQSILIDSDAVVMAGGSTIPRDLKIPGRELAGVDFAMDFLEASNRSVAGENLSSPIQVTGKNVIVIGGGDTGADCVGTSNRQGAKSVTQIELMTKPPKERDENSPWPKWPMILRTSTSHKEGCEREWSIQTKGFIGNDKRELIGLQVVEVEWKKDASTGKMVMTEIEGTEKTLPCEQVFLAIGFLHPKHAGLLKELGVELDRFGNVATTDYQTSANKIFAAGDMRMGQSLVVNAIAEGRNSAAAVCAFLGLSGQSGLDL